MLGAPPGRCGGPAADGEIGTPVILGDANRRGQSGSQGPGITTLQCSHVSCRGCRRRRQSWIDGTRGSHRAFARRSCSHASRRRLTRRSHSPNRRWTRATFMCKRITPSRSMALPVVRLGRLVVAQERSRPGNDERPLGAGHVRATIELVERRFRVVACAAPGSRLEPLHETPSEQAEVVAPDRRPPRGTTPGAARRCNPTRYAARCRSTRRQRHLKHA